MDGDRILKQIARCTPEWHNTGVRYDNVLVGHPDGPGNGLDRFEVCRLLLLFKFQDRDIEENPEQYELAYIQWFRKKSHHKLNQMLMVELTETFDVISVESIYHPIHLVPKFEIQDDIKTTVAHHKTSDDFREFYINSYIDQHAFINCY
jgi:hypothetical protein